MSTFEIVLVAAVVMLVASSLAAWLLIRSARAEARRVMSRVAKLPWRAKLQLAAGLARDERIPLALRLLPPAMLLYLALPVDLIPDFIPVLGQLDDIVILALGAGLMLRFVPRRVIDERLLAAESMFA